MSDRRLRTRFATAERLGASAVATRDLRCFGVVATAGTPTLLPHDA